MAISGTNRGVGGNISAATTIAATPGSNFTAGSFAVFALAYDNSGNQGADPYSSITDDAGNTWTSRQNILNDPGAASAGSTLRIFTSQINTFTTANSVTVTFGTSTTAKAWTLTEFTTNTSGAVIQYLTGGTSTGASTTPTMNTASITINNAVFGAMGNEGNATVTADADTTNGVWSTQQTTAAGTGVTGMQVASQFKVVTATGTQTYNPTLSATGDWSTAWIEITEIVSESFDPMGMMGFFGI